MMCSTTAFAQQVDLTTSKSCLKSATDSAILTPTFAGFSSRISWELQKLNLEFGNWDSIGSPNLMHYIASDSASEAYRIQVKDSATNVIAFSNAIIICRCGVLPVTLSYFTGSIKNNAINISWETVSEENFFHFEVQRSLDGDHFSTIEVVPASGTTDNTVDYNAIDKNINNKYIFYRLKIVDKDGHYSYSNVIVMRINVPLNKNIIIANPVDDQIAIIYNGLLEQNKAIVQLYSLEGKILKNQSFGNGIVDVSNLPSGFYICRIIDSKGNILFHKEIMKQ
ncbi:MAG: T9SS type A sorting domain-containing protein [Patescibacteria group bacterium]|nr:T9SS type A sorting domain-containing protein [Patescibacteria group bacterium]